MQTIRHLLLILLCYCALPTLAQNLLPSIGVGSLPNDADPTCYFQCSIDPDGTFMQVGPQVGEMMPDFTLYDINNNPFNLQAALQLGKPVLLLGGSYTCGYFRSKRNLINNIVATYPNEITVAIVYTIEAHPENDSSIYFCDFNQLQSNLNQGILYDMATTYGQRKATATDMLNNLNFNAPVYLDGPCNEWLSYFGPAPSNAYLVDTSGVIFAKHGWFNTAPNNIYNDIDSLLGNGSNPPNPLDGTFTWSIADSMAYGTPGQEIIAYGNLKNLSSGDAMIEIVREVNNMPSQGWASSMCVDLCLPPTADTTLLLLEKDSIEDFHMHFYTDQVPNTGSVKISFRNLNDPNNRVEQWFYGTTTATGIAPLAVQPSDVLIYPNPGNGQGQLQINSNAVDFTTSIAMKVYHLNGQLVEQFNFTGQGPHAFALRQPAPGIYSYQLFGEAAYLTSGKLVVR